MSPIYSLVCFPFKVLFKLLYRVEVTGAELVEESGGALIASSHASFFDPPLIACTAPGQVHFLARESLFRVPILSKVLPRVHTHPVQGNSSTKSIRTVVQFIKEGSKVVIFPEGHRSIDGDLHSLQPGIGLIVARAECPIIPCYIDGAFKVWGRDRKYPRPWGKIRIIYGAPIPWSQFADLPKRERTEAIRNATEIALATLKAELKAM
jgi:1-acyl-sn-glycerol-3-phosphate acyltransferase